MLIRNKQLKYIIVDNPKKSLFSRYIGIFNERIVRSKTNNFISFVKILLNAECFQFYIFTLYYEQNIRFSLTVDLIVYIEQY